MALERRHGGMDMDMSSGGTGGFRPTNERLARAYWYTITGVVGSLTALRLARILESRRRRQAHKQDASTITSHPHGMLAQALATTTAVVREMAYAQPVYFTGRISNYFSPLPVGRWILLCLYWTVLLCFLWTDTILHPDDEKYAYKWEKVGYRAAWVSISQIPFIYLLSCKLNPISLLTGISYERFNWLHRWSARTVFLTVIVHWSWFYRQWDIASFVKYQLEMMPMVKYGFGAWAVIGWMVLTGFGFVRAQRYEIFVAQHICAAATLLWLLWVHVPSYATYHIWMSVAFVVFDWGCRIVWALLQNSHALGGFRVKTPGYSVQLDPLPGEMVRLSLSNVDFGWRAGQHVYISIPRLRPFELHPFTIANTCTGDQRLSMVVKAHFGFTKSLLKAAMKGQQEYAAFLSGPWGNPPDLLHYDSVVFVACSSGASFTVPLLRDLMQKDSCARSVAFHWVVRETQHMSWYEKDIRQAIEDAREHGVRLQVIVHVTRFASSETPIKSDKTEAVIDVGSASDSSSTSLMSSNGATATNVETTSSSHTSCWTLSEGRPDVKSIIRPPVESARGETAVVVCGGLSVTAEARTFVAALSDERGVHKGTGAQGIFLFTETYGW